MQGDAGGGVGSPRSPGQVVMGVAIKLVVDMWLTAGPAASLPLALLLLRRCYGSLQPALRRRAFDLLANLMVGMLAAHQIADLFGLPCRLLAIECCVALSTLGYCHQWHWP